MSGERSASCGPRRRRRQRKKRRTRRLSKGKLMPLRCCRCRSSRFRVQPSWRLTVHRAVPRAEIHLPVNCRSSDMPTETTASAPIKVLVFCNSTRTSATPTRLGLPAMKPIERCRQIIPVSPVNPATVQPATSRTNCRPETRSAPTFEDADGCALVLPPRCCAAGSLT